jgi:hypothetical protein
MHGAFHCRVQAERARRLAREQTDPLTKARLHRAAREYDQLADDLEAGAIEICDVNTLPQRNR